MINKLAATRPDASEKFMTEATSMIRIRILSLKLQVFVYFLLCICDFVFVFYCFSVPSRTWVDNLRLTNGRSARQDADHW